MRLGRRLVLLTAVATLLCGPIAAVAAAAPAASAATAGALSATASQGWVRCANLSPGTPEEVYLYPFGNPGHPIMLMHYGYGSVSGYMPVSSGQYTLAMRPAGAPASNPPSVSTSFMVSAGTNYTVASIGPASARRLVVLQDQLAAPEGKVLVRVIQASLKQPRVTVGAGPDVLARQLASGSASPYQAISAGTRTIAFSVPGGQVRMPGTLAAGSVHTIVVLDGTAGLRIDVLADAAGSENYPRGGAATGLGGTAPGGTGPHLAPWLATLAAGLLLAGAGMLRLRRSRSAVPARG